jgi:hypothetical protein
VQFHVELQFTFAIGCRQDDGAVLAIERTGNGAVNPKQRTRARRVRELDWGLLRRKGRAKAYERVVAPGFFQMEHGSNYVRLLRGSCL